MQYSITEVTDLINQQRPIYATKPIPVFSKVNFGNVPVTKQNKPIAVQGYLGTVYGYALDSGVLYFKVADENVYNDGLFIYVRADKDSITINEADSPPIKVGFFEGLIDGIGNSSIGSGISNIATKGIVIFAGFWFLKSVVLNYSKDKVKSKLKTIAE